MGDVVAAVDRYVDIPADVRSRLKQRMARHDYDEIVEIRRDRIVGRQRYDSDISDMHFGDGSVCHKVTRSGWTAQMQQQGLVYCESGACILVPTVCRNVSRIVRRDAPAPLASTGRPAAGSDDELQFAPPGAGAPALAEGLAVPLGTARGVPESFATRSAASPAQPLVDSLVQDRGVAYGEPSMPSMEARASEAHHALQPTVLPGREDSSGFGPSSDWDAGPDFGSGPGPETFWPGLPFPGRHFTPSTPAPSELPTPVPEPQTWLLFGCGLALLGLLRRRRRPGRLPRGR